MRRRTPEQIEALSYEQLSNWQLFKMLQVCGGIWEVNAPEEASRIQRMLIWFANLDPKDSSFYQKVICYIVIIPVVVIPISVLFVLPDIVGTPQWIGYMSASVHVIGIFVLIYASKIASFKAGGAELVVDAYKKRKLPKERPRRSVAPDSSGEHYS